MKKNETAILFVNMNTAEPVELLWDIEKFIPKSPFDFLEASQALRKYAISQVQFVI